MSKKVKEMLGYKPELLHLKYRSSNDIRNYFRFYKDEK